MIKQLWNELAKTALLGTSNRELPEAILQILQKEGFPKDQDPESTLLLAAAYFYPHLKVNTPSYTNDITSLNPPKDKDQEEKQVLNRKSVQHLELILNGGYKKALPEFLNQMSSCNRSLAPEFLPDLFNYSLEHPTQWETLQKGIGSLGKWLLLQNPDWEQLAPLSDPEYWNSGTPIQRVSYLKTLRKDVPAQARVLLASFWEDLGYREKVRFLNVLKIQLSKEDEPLLEQAQVDKRKEVRTQAIDLLSRIPDSNYAYQLFESAKALFSIDNKQFKIPKELERNPALEKAGIGLNPSPHFKGGLKIVLISDLIAKIPPHYWEQHFDISISAIINAMLQNPYSDRIFLAITLAAIRYDNQEWKTSIAQILNVADSWPKWDTPTGKDLLNNLSDDDFNNLLEAYLAKGAYLIGEKSMAYYLINQGKYNWNDRNTKRIIQQFQEAIGASSSYSWGAWHYRSILKEAAYNCNPFLLDWLKTGWPIHSANWRQWEGIIEQFLQVLFFRKEMIQSLQKDTP